MPTTSLPAHPGFENPSASFSYYDNNDITKLMVKPHTLQDKNYDLTVLKIDVCPLSHTNIN